ncbi:hypothetical protein [Candidatus Symbiothrix dinenymphae]|uniref:hypothetical protein n=1 Tax=Candidatus Symbiothrix dinenymphae TaxID=467085 RepID=UPI00070324AB|nr:hypothetical protein [Candidatus Symbiothrix dinenymphae]
MKKFIINVVLFLLVSLMFPISLEMVLRHIPNDYSYTKDYLDTHANEIEILILGGSHTFLGIDPIYFSDNAFNAAYASQPLNYDYAILKKYDEKLVNLKMVIIAFSYVSLWHQLAKDRDGDARWIKNYILYYGIKSENDPIKLHFEVLSNSFERSISQISSYFKGTNIKQSKLGWGTTYLAHTPDVETAGKDRAIAHTKDIHSPENQKLFADNVAFLDSIIQICQSHNAKVLLLTTPNYKAYREHLNEEQLNVMINTANEMANKHPNCTYMNLMDDSTFVSTDYFDADHLCGVGAKKLSLKLANYIEEQNLYKPSCPQ